MFRMKYVIEGVVCLIIDKYHYFIIQMREWTSSFIYLFFVFCKAYREYKILHQTSYCIIRTTGQL